MSTEALLPPSSESPPTVEGESHNIIITSAANHNDLADSTSSSPSSPSTSPTEDISVTTIDSVLKTTVSPPSESQVLSSTESSSPSSFPSTSTVSSTQASSTTSSSSSSPSSSSSSPSPAPAPAKSPLLSKTSSSSSSSSLHHRSSSGKIPKVSSSGNPSPSPFPLRPAVKTSSSSNSSNSTGHQRVKSAYSTPEELRLALERMEKSLQIVDERVDNMRRISAQKGGNNDTTAPSNDGTSSPSPSSAPTVTIPIDHPSSTDEDTARLSSRQRTSSQIEIQSSSSSSSSSPPSSTPSPHHDTLATLSICQVEGCFRNALIVPSHGNLYGSDNTKYSRNKGKKEGEGKEEAERCDEDGCGIFLCEDHSHFFFKDEEGGRKNYCEKHARKVKNQQGACCVVQ